MKWIISNHKQALEDNEISEYKEKLKNIKNNNLKLVICPSHKNIKYFKDNNYELGSQDIEESIELLKKYQVKYTIVGHSDRRLHDNETDFEINKKIKELLKNDIVPILCIGEEKNTNIKDVIKNQIKNALKEIKNEIIIAYEPIWAINSGMIPSIDDLENIIDYIKNEAFNILNIKPIILYGGSVNEETIIKLKQIKSIDGYMIGNASLNVENLEKIINIINE